MRDENCTLCPLSEGISPARVCIPATPRGHVDVLVVSKYPMSDKAQVEFTALWEEAGNESLTLAFTAVSRCSNWGADATRAHQKVCADTYLKPEIADVKPQWTIALGGEALYVLTGKRQITKARGEHPGNVFATISPLMIKRNPGLRESLIGDLRYLGLLMTGTAPQCPPPERILAVRTKGALKALQRRLMTCEGMYYDIETNGFDEFKPESVMVSLSFTFWNKGDTAPRDVWVLPLGHPESPFLSNWRKVLRDLGPYVMRPAKRVAHNGKFDGRWMSEFGAPVPLTFDTMLAAYLLNENRPKGLKDLCQSLLNVPPWGIDTRNLMEERLGRVLKYNALDTWNGAYLYFHLRAQIMDQPRLARILAKILVPASNEFTEIERKGLWVDRERLASRAIESRQTLEAIDAELLTFVPPQEEWPPGIKAVNFNASNFARWFLFDYLKLPILARGKDKEDGSPGAPSMAEGVLERLRDDHPVLPVLLSRGKWQKYTSAFFSAYEEQVDDNDRIHTAFKLTGTVTGRLSSGKNDADKVTGRVQNRGVNLQQVPRDDFVRGVFGAPPGWVFVECDYSQVELRVAAFAAQEPTMLALYNTGRDIHTAMAMRMTGKPEDLVTKDERKKAKAVNFGFLYGMGWAKFIETAWSNYGVIVSETEAQAFRRAFFDEFPKLTDWHKRQRRLVSQFARVESPLGRVRHLPDIRSENRDVRAEAQRQAINSPVQSFASDMTVMSLIELSRWFKRQGLKSHSVGTVHDAINFSVPLDEVPRVVPRIRLVMENLPLHKYGVHLNVPIVADVKIGTRWGGAEEIAGEISSSPTRLKEWMKEREWQN